MTRTSIGGPSLPLRSRTRSASSRLAAVSGRGCTCPPGWSRAGSAARDPKASGQERSLSRGVSGRKGSRPVDPTPARRLDTGRGVGDAGRMLRTSSPVRTLGLGDVQHAMEVCARDPVTNVFVAARILEGGLSSGRVAVLGYDDGDEQGLCWAGANIVPVECTPAMVVAFAEKVARRRRSASSLCGPADAVLHLWSLLEPEWGQAREVRAVQPVLTMAVSPSAAGVAADPLVRPALDHELD